MDYIKANRELWEKRTQTHLESEFYDMEKFMGGKSSLNTFEIELLGDVRGKSILHLQCHFGQDSLSLARMGAKVTGVDFTPSAIEAAKKINAELGLDAEFVCCNVLDTRQYVTKKFDIVFTSYGTIGWLPDLQPWAKVIADSLNDGGKFVIVDFHPFVWMMDDDYSEIKYSYFNDEVITTESTGSYAAGRELHAPMKEFGWNHPLSEVMNALTHAGLLMEIIQESDGSPYNCFPGMEAGADGLFRFKKWGKKLPLIYSLVFRKQHNAHPNQ